MPARFVPSSTRVRIRDLPPAALVRVYSIQNTRDIEAAAEGIYSPQPAYLHDEGEDDWLRAYDWMREQMAAQIPSFTGRYPVWAWLARPNPRKNCRPDAPCSLLVADVPRGRMVLSDYGTWHMPLNNWALALTHAESDALPDRLPQADTIATWHHCLRIEDRTDPAEIYWMGRSPEVQACIDTILPHEIVSVTPWSPTKS